VNIISVSPMMALSGVRDSWLMLATKQGSPRDGPLLSHVARRINLNGSNRRWMKLQWHVNLIGQISVRKDDGQRR